jgi:hypothetical protein
MPRHEATHNTNTNTKEGKMRQDILTAWKRGERSFDEVVEITGYPAEKVAYYLPVGIRRF